MCSLPGSRRVQFCGPARNVLGVPYRTVPYPSPSFLSIPHTVPFHHPLPLLLDWTSHTNTRPYRTVPFMLICQNCGRGKGREGGGDESRQAVRPTRYEPRCIHPSIHPSLTHSLTPHTPTHSLTQPISGYDVVVGHTRTEYGTGVFAAPGHATFLP